MVWLELLRRLPVKQILFVLAFLPFILLTVVGGALGSILPSGSKNVTSSYQHAAQQVGEGNVNWADLYILDYFRRQNDFDHITDSNIRATAKLFVKTVTVTVTTKGPDGKSVTKKVQEKEYLSLLDVMTNLGYTHQDYEDALQLEDLIGAGDGVDESYLPPVTVPELRYKDVDPHLLFQYVHARGSVFTIQDMEDMETAAKKYDINPILMLAITGQEQSFVPATDPDAGKIHNNPWNVYHSWMDYNTTFSDAADIAANTLHHKLMTDPPPGENPILWINDPKNPWGIYAEDPHWAYGVADIFASIENYVPSKS